MYTYQRSLKWKMFALKWGRKMFLRRGICVSEVCLGHRSFKKLNQIVLHAAKGTRVIPLPYMCILQHELDMC